MLQRSKLVSIVTFIVRLWAEYLEQTPPAWRGEIEHVGGGEVNRFGDVSKMLRFVEGSTGLGDWWSCSGLRVCGPFRRPLTVDKSG